MANSVASDKPRRGFKEFVRKFFVTLKRNPHNIALVLMLFTFVFYSLNLTVVSNTTARVQMPNMGQCEFVTMLFGILAFVSFLRAFPRREKSKLSMIVLTMLLLGASIFTDLVYVLRIKQAMTRVDPQPIVVTEETQYITQANNLISVHIVLLVVCIALIVLLPVYSKLIRKINTSIEVAGNDDIAAIDISGED